MNITEPFVRRPVATTLLTIGVALAGIVSFGLLPISPLPQVDFPVVSVSASLPGASPEVMAATVATPLERALGRIAGVNEITSSSSLGNARVTLQFELNKDINSAAREVQAAIQAARTELPSSLPNNPTYRKVNPADSPIMILAMTSDTFSRGQMYDMASTNIAQRISQVAGVGQVTVGGGSLPAVRVELNPTVLNRLGIGFDEVRTAITSTNANRPKGFLEEGDRYWQIQANDQAKSAAEYIPIIVAYRNGAAVRLGDLGRVEDSVQDLRNHGMANGKPAVLLIINRQPNANIIETGRRHPGPDPGAQGLDPRGSEPRDDDGAHDHDPRVAARDRADARDLDRAGDPRGVPVPAKRALRPSSPRSPCRSPSSAPSARCTSSASA
jgi:multidrug efflux pump